ncbi:YqgE/AlgH family protein [Nonlabens sp. SY33080]|uniref:YqgE/AlgH family protein n=1 Tax=Nonlabens sp. SY33080 TaxID=2719911 RepID=UPI001428C41C|nr:YqgE/AlgH family protein [Nonlabens sp. SY33080]
MKIVAPDRGHLLVSEPSVIGDYSFSRSVVLITDYNEAGVVGFILNKPLDCTLDQLLPEVSVNFEVFQGGPVDTDNLYFLHNVPELIPDSHLIKDDIYWGGDFNVVIDLINKNLIEPSNIKFFLGYSGWELEQLDNELNANSWVVVENTDKKKLLTKNMIAFWKEKMKTLGGNYQLWLNAPENPNYN